MMQDVREHYGTIKCATCMISCGCNNCIRGDDLAEIYELRVALTSIYDLCTVHAVPGAFANGVTDTTGTIDEGEVYAAGIFDQARALLTQPQGSSGGGDG